MEQLDFFPEVSGEAFIVFPRYKVAFTRNPHAEQRAHLFLAEHGDFQTSISFSITSKESLIARGFLVISPEPLPPDRAFNTHLHTRSFQAKPKEPTRLVRFEL